MAPFLAAAFLFSTPPVTSSCDRAYEAVVALSAREAELGYAHEVLREGRAAFVRSCATQLTRAQVRCVAAASTSEQLYACTP